MGLAISVLIIIVFAYLFSRGSLDKMLKELGFDVKEKK